MAFVSVGKKISKLFFDNAITAMYRQMAGKKKYILFFNLKISLVTKFEVN